MGWRPPAPRTERVRVPDKILFVDSSPKALQTFERLLVPGYDVTLSRTAEDALERVGVRDPFAVVACDHDLGRMRGSDFLVRVSEKLPDCVPIVMAGAIEVDVAINALHQDHIYRLLEKPCPGVRLRQVIDEALCEHRRRRKARRRTVELDFSSRVLTDFNSRLEELVSEQTASMVHLHSYVSELNSGHSLEDIAAATADAASEVCMGRGAHVELWGGAEGGEPFRASDGLELTPRRHVQTIETAEGQVGSIVVSELDQRGRKLTDTQRAMLASMAASCAVAVHNQIRRRERDEAQHVTIVALAKLAERRDNETGKHLERVSLYCKLIAEGLRADGRYLDQITDEWIRDLVRSAPLHDIGKVGIPDHILLKPGKLDAAELSIMQTHVEIGAETLRGVNADHALAFLEMSTDIAASHHEKWDGSGYPEGLAGEQIPLSARILALADVYDALTSRRPYKDAWTHEDSTSWISSGAGSHFDPAVVEAFVSREEEAGVIREQLADTGDTCGRFGPSSA